MLLPLYCCNKSYHSAITAPVTPTFAMNTHSYHLLPPPSLCPLVCCNLVRDIVYTLSLRLFSGRGGELVNFALRPRFLQELWRRMELFKSGRFVDKFFETVCFSIFVLIFVRISYKQFIETDISNRY